MFRARHIIIASILASAACMSAACPSFAADASGNIDVSIPVDIRIGTSPTGRLISPSASALQIENRSDFEVRISSMRFNPNPEWNMVADAYDSSLPNSASISIGPSSDKIDLSTCAGASVKVSDEGAWTMSTREESLPLSKIGLEVDGAVSNVGTRSLGDSLGTVEWRIASDTVTNQVLTRLDALESADVSLQGEIDDAVTNITRADNTFTATRSDGSTFTFDQKDDDTTYTAGDGLALSSNVFSNAGVTGVKGAAEGGFRTGNVSLGWEDLGVAPISNGGTGATDAAGARANLGAAAASHGHNFVDIAPNAQLNTIGYNMYYTTFARMPKGNSVSNGQCQMIISALGDYGGMFQGCWHVSISNRGNKASMKVVTLSGHSQGTVTFGYYTSGDYFYFGVYRGYYSGDGNIWVLSSSQATVQDFGDTATAPSGWTAVTPSTS